MAAKSFTFKGLKGAERTAKIAQFAKNPGTRYRIALDDLPTEYKKKRIANLSKDVHTRVGIPDKYTSLMPAPYRDVRNKRKADAKPVVEGSDYTVGELNTDRHNEEVLRYGKDPINAAEAKNQKVGDWYEAYVRDLGAAAEKVNGYAQQANQQVSSLQGAVPGAYKEQGQSAGNTADAANAANVRGQMLAAYGSQIANQGALGSTYAQQLASGVGGAQLLEGKDRQRKITDSKIAEVGAWRNKFNSDAKKNAADRVLALKALSDKGQLARDELAAKTAGDAADAAAKGAEGDHYGYTNAQWAKMGPAERTAAAKAWKLSTALPKAPKAPKTPKKKDVPWIGQVKQNALHDELKRAQSMVNNLRSSENTKLEQQYPGYRTNRHLLARLMLGNVWTGSQIALQAALDLSFNKELSRGTVNELKSQKYKITPLGVPFRSPPPRGAGTYSKGDPARGD